MTTTAYDTAAILRQNVADLERELQRQRERADIALSELEATRDDNHKMMGEILGLREQHSAATARLRDQIERVTSEWERADKAIPAPAPAVPEEWKSAAADAVYAMRWWAAQEDGVPEEVAPVFMKLHTLLGWSISCAADQSAVRALLQSAQAAPALNTSSVGSDFDDLLREDGTLEQCEKIANKRGIMSPVNACHFRDHCRKLVQAPTPAVPEEWRNIVTEMVGWWDDQHMTLTQGKAIREKARALLQSATAAPAVPGPYLLGGRRFKISINGEGGFYGFEGFPELNGQWVALVDATDNQHMQSAGGGK